MERPMLLALFFFLLTLPTTVFSFERYHTSIDTLLHSEALTVEKRIQITLPIEYQKGIVHDFPVIVLFEQEDDPHYRFLLQTIDYLTSSDQIPSSVIVAVFAHSGNQQEDQPFLHPDEPGRTARMEQFILQELLPVIRSTYAGSSFTTLIAQLEDAVIGADMLARHCPEIHAVIAGNPLLSPAVADSLHSAWKAPALPYYTYLRCSFGSHFEQEYAHLQGLLKRITPEKSRLNTGSVLFTEANPGAADGLYVGQALYEIFAVWSANQELYFDRNEHLIAQLSQIEEDNRKHYGVPLTLSLAALNGKAWKSYNNGDYQQAIEAWNAALTCYPNFSEAYLYIAYALKDLGQPIAPVLRQFEENYSTSLFYSDDERELLMHEYQLLLTIPEMKEE